MHRKAQCRAQHGEGDAGVAAGGVQQGFAGNQQPPHTSIAHNRRGGPGLDAATGVGPLRLGQQGDVFQATNQLVKPDERRIADPLG